MPSNTIRPEDEPLEPVALVELLVGFAGRGTETTSRSCERVLKDAGCEDYF